MQFSIIFCQIIAVFTAARRYGCAFNEKVEVDQGNDRDGNQEQTGSLFVESDRQVNESLLRTLLIHNGIYDRRHHPIFDGDGLNVSMSLALLNLIEIDEYKETISVTAEMALKWYDQHISWDPSKFGNISVLSASDSDIYHPEVLLINALFHTDQLPFASSMALLHSTGKVLWFPRATLRTRCEVDPVLWPYTTLYCDFKFGVPVHDSRVRLFLRSKHIFVKLYAQHHSWTVVKASQFIMNESSVELRELYGTDELPWVRLYLRKTPSTFVTSVLAASLVVLVLNGFLLMHNWKSEAHYIVCALSLIFFGGLHVWTSVIIPSSPTIPWFSLFLALASILLFSTLLTLPVLIGRRPSNLHQTSSLKVFLAFTSLLTKIFTRLDTSRYLDICGPGCGKLQVGGLVKGCAVVVYWASALLITSLTLRPFLQESYAEGST